MARPRSFDDDQIRARIQHQFWAHGYESTGLSDLEAATGLSRKSLYNAFGDKQAMFVAALSQFRQNAVRTRIAALRADGAGRDAIAALLVGLAEFSETPEGAFGCMICNTSREDIADEPLVQAQIRRYFDDIEAALLVAVRYGQAQGDIKDRDPQALARLCLGAVVSISVLAKAGQPKDVLTAIATETIYAL